MTTMTAESTGGRSEERRLDEEQNYELTQRLTALMRLHIPDWACDIEVRLIEHGIVSTQVVIKLPLTAFKSLGQDRKLRLDGEIGEGLDLYYGALMLPIPFNRIISYETR